MFIRSIRITRLRVTLCAVLCCLLVFGAAFFLRGPGQDSGAVVTSASAQKVDYTAKTAEDHLTFLAQFGYACDPVMLESVEVVIPSEFDDVYETYNALQKEENGLDLKNYRGRRVKRYTYLITNFADYDGPVIANLLVYKEKVIGGDVCSLALDGFMQGFPTE